LAAYSIYLQLPSIAGGHPSIPNQRECHAVLTGTDITWYIQDQLKININNNNNNIIPGEITSNCSNKTLTAQKLSKMNW
jgi:hypothetical protein